MQETLVLSRQADPEARLIESVRARAPSAWRDLYHRYFPKMYAYAYCRTGDRAAAEDIAAQVFLEAWKRINSFKYRGVPLSAWLYRIAHNLSADALRRRNRIRFESLSDEMPAAQQSGNHEEAIATRQEVAAALRGLTPEQQQVVVMRFVEGMSVAAVAAAIGRSEEAVKALQSRALKSLRKRFEITREDGTGGGNRRRV